MNKLGKVEYGKSKFIHRVLINNLIEAVEKSTYAEKEQFIEFLPKMIEVLKQRQVEEGKT